MRANDEQRKNTLNTPTPNDQKINMSSPPSDPPSPIISPPIPTAPGPRASALQKLYDDAVTHIIKTCSYSNFASCFPTPAAEVPQSMAQLHAQFTAKLGASMRREFSGILEERGVVASLNQLDGLIEEARGLKRRAEEEGKGSVPVPPHTLPAEKLYLAHLTPLLAEPMREIRARQSSLETENIELLNRVQAQRKEIERMVKGLETAVGELEASVMQLEQGPEMEVLRAEAREAEGEMDSGLG